MMEFKTHKALKVLVDLHEQMINKGKFTSRFSQEFCNDLINEFNFISDAMTVLQRAIIILPDDAEPLPGDFCRYLNSDAAYCTGVFPERQDQGKNRWRLWGSLACDVGDTKLKIIQRNGKPVIYKSDLKK